MKCVHYTFNSKVTIIKLPQSLFDFMWLRKNRQMDDIKRRESDSRNLTDESAVEALAVL